MRFWRISTHLLGRATWTRQIYTYIGPMIQDDVPNRAKKWGSCTTWSNSFANVFLFCAFRPWLQRVFFSHLQAGPNSTELLNITITEISSTKPRRANRNSQGSQRSWAQIKPTSETEGMNHKSQSANNQSINRWIDQSINQSINQPSTDRSISQAID